MREGGQGTPEHGTQCSGLGNKVGVRHRLDWMVWEGFSNLMIPWSVQEPLYIHGTHVICATTAWPMQQNRDGSLCCQTATATKRFIADRAVHLSVTERVKTEPLSAGALMGSVSRIKPWSFSQPQTTVICLMGNANCWLGNFSWLSFEWEK